ncbi:MAG: hypothetical protein C9356_12035 [Oleiphilus sp.]|nr:MAG: hypothetical protein C9356_12035 [Oleiphilus sp.]
MLLIDCVLKAVKSVPGPNGDDPDFNASIAMIQSYIGQDDGGLAALFFDDDVLERWSRGNSDARVVIAGEYVSFETHYGWECPEEAQEINEPNDLFNRISSLPTDVIVILEAYEKLLETGAYDRYALCKLLLSEMKLKGLWFDFGLDGVPYGLRQLPT